MTAIITLPGTLASVPPGMEEAILLEPSGFISRSLEALYLFEETSGTTIADELGGAAGVIDSLASSNNAYSWLSGGGLSLSGAQLASFPAFEQASAWTMISGGMSATDFGGAGEKIVGLLGSRNFGAAQIRGAYLFHRGQTDLDVTQATGFYSHRPSSGTGTLGTAESLLPILIPTAQVRRVVMLSFDGVNTVESRVYDKDGTLIAFDVMTATAATLFTISGTTLSNIQWVLGGLSATYANGVHQHEFAARYSHKVADFSAAEITQICAAAADLGAERGRAW